MPKKIAKIADARVLLRRRGHCLQETKSASGSEFAIMPAGATVTKPVARQLLQQCREADPGLLPGISQSWWLKRR